jgi:hypothetical protein
VCFRRQDEENVYNVGGGLWTVFECLHREKGVDSVFDLLHVFYFKSLASVGNLHFTVTIIVTATTATTFAFDFHPLFGGRVLYDPQKIGVLRLFDA